MAKAKHNSANCIYFTQSPRTVSRLPNDSMKNFFLCMQIDIMKIIAQIRRIDKCFQVKSVLLVPFNVFVIERIFTQKYDLTLYGVYSFDMPCDT